MMRTAILLVLSLVLHFQVCAVSLLTIDAERDKYEEGHTANFSFTYIQTEGCYFPDAVNVKDGWDFDGLEVQGKSIVSSDPYVAGKAAFKYSLAYNSFVSLVATLNYNNAFVATVRKNINLGYDASIQVSRGLETYVTLFVRGEQISTVSLKNGPSDLKLSIDVKGKNLRVWVDSDTLVPPVLTYNNLEEVDGYFQIKNGAFMSSEAKSSAFYNVSCRTDYAYGLQFILNKVDGSYIHDVLKNDNRLLCAEYVQSSELSEGMQKLIDSLGISIPKFKHSAKPPYFYNSTNDNGYWYCDNQPTTMAQPIPYSSVFHIKWQERIDSCGPRLQNRVTVRLYGHEDGEISATHSCPCSENTCFLDSVYISAPASSFCQGETLPLTAELVGKEVLDKEKFDYQWTVNGIPVPETSDVLTTSIPGNFGVRVTKSGDLSCAASSQFFTVRTDERPVLNLKDTTGCSGPGVVLTAISSQDYKPFFSYKWNTGSKERFIKVRESGVYSVTVQNGQCADSAEAFVEVEPCTLPSLDGLQIQNVVTPNGDGVNDFFQIPLLVERFPRSRVSLYNRYGELLYEKNAEEFKWDGSYCGHRLPSGDYWYEIYVPGLYRYYLGHVTLLWQ